ncbi:MAG: hypothetical protein JSV66_07920 [Trueperaceae bacterium]|nr:MAG: hypothetical protein JSV66_07920 [Trueperaceae bacterium]
MPRDYRVLWPEVCVVPHVGKLENPLVFWPRSSTAYGFENRSGDVVIDERGLLPLLQIGRFSYTVFEEGSEALNRNWSKVRSAHYGTSGIGPGAFLLGGSMASYQEYSYLIPRVQSWDLRDLTDLLTEIRNDQDLADIDRKALIDRVEELIWQRAQSEYGAG